MRGLPYQFVLTFGAVERIGTFSGKAQRPVEHTGKRGTELNTLRTGAGSSVAEEYPQGVGG